MFVAGGRVKNMIPVPTGLDEIVAIFGSIDDLAFEDKNIVLFDLPYPLIYTGKEVKRSRCHCLLVEVFQEIFQEIKNKGLEDEAKNFGGIYARRSIRDRPSFPSTHSFGIAIDLEPQKYPLGSDKRMPEELIKTFEQWGFFYGGDFKSRKDPQHFQYAKNY